MIIDPKSALQTALASSPLILTYIDPIVASAQANQVQGYSVVKFALGLCSLGEQETLWGTTRDLDRQGPSGTGDYAARTGKWLRMPDVVVVNTLPGLWKSGQPGPWSIPFDERGWGRGLLQEDWGSNSAWLTSNDWTDPAVAIMRAGWRWKQLLMEASLIEQDAFDGYNEGICRVDLDLKAGLDPDSTTTGGRYGETCLARLNGWAALIPDSLT